MKLKGGIAYIDMKGNLLDNVNDSGGSIFVEGLYKASVKAVKSGKIIVLYNCGGMLQNVSIIIYAYNIYDSGIVSMRFTIVKTNASVANRCLFVKPDSTYYNTNA